MKAIGYVRVSTDDQANNGVSLDNQRAKISSYANLKGFDLIEIIEDAGISAKNLKRPGVQCVLDMAKSKQVDAVIVYKLDRMFRNTIDALETTQKFDRWGVSFHSINETLDTRSAMGKFFFTIMAGIAEMERGIIGERTKQALDHKKANGEKLGGTVPFGYFLRSGKLIPNRHEQSIISLIHDLKNKNYSLRSICRSLEKKGYLTKTGNKIWNPKTVSFVLNRHVA